MDVITISAIANTALAANWGFRVWSVERQENFRAAINAAAINWSEITSPSELGNTRCLENGKDEVWQYVGIHRQYLELGVMAWDGCLRGLGCPRPKCAEGIVER